LVGATTFDPNAQDVKFLQAWFGQALPSSPAKP
jgi:hypothetical protein